MELGTVGEALLAVGQTMPENVLRGENWHFLRLPSGKLELHVHDTSRYGMKIIRVAEDGSARRLTIWEVLCELIDSYARVKQISLQETPSE